MMKNCKKCDEEFEPSKGLIDYCSLACRNSRVRTDEIKDKIGAGVNKSNVIKKEKGTFSKERYESWLRGSSKKKNTIRQRLLSVPFESLSFERLKRRIKYEQDDKCNRCGNNEWMGENLILELEHKDGDNKNNKRDNLECLCPNCHSLTKTWRGRNKKGRRVPVGVKRVSDEVLVIAVVKHNYNFRRALLEVGLAAKGSNYGRCHRLKREILEGEEEFKK
jgi:hypothetical protein